MPLRATWAVHLLHDPIIVADADWRVVEANPAAVSLFGARASEGRSALDLIGAYEGTALARRLRDAAHSPTPVRFGMNLASTVEQGHYEVTVTAFADEIGAGVLIDLRPRGSRTSNGSDNPERVTQGLVDAGIALSSALSLPQVLQILADHARSVVGARYAAMSVVNVAGTGLADFIVSGLSAEQRAKMGDLPAGHGILGLVIREGRTICLADLRMHPDSIGTPPHHPSMRSFLGVPVTAKGRIFGNLYVTDKITEPEFSDDDLKVIETLAAQAAVAIEAAQVRHERDRFFASTGHEIGNIVAGIKLWSGLVLRDTSLEDKTRAAVDQIARGIIAAEHLVEDLLSLSRIREGRMTLTSWPVDVTATAREAIDHFRAKAETEGQVIELDAPSESPVVRADLNRVRQILLNLLSNAVKFTPRGGRISVGVQAEADGGAVVWVRDTGPGIPTDQQDRIFLPFEQVASTAAGRGSGLGLAVSLELARLMGGELRVESEVGAGSTFRLRLPRSMPLAA